MCVLLVTRILFLPSWDSDQIWSVLMWQQSCQKWLIFVRVVEAQILSICLVFVNTASADDGSVWFSVLPAPSATFSFFLLLQHKFSPVLFDLPSVFLVLELKTFKQWRVDWTQVMGDHWFNFLQDQTSCCLWCSFTTCMHNIFSAFCSFLICLTLFGLFYFYLIFVLIFFLHFSFLWHCLPLLFAFFFPLWFLLPSPSCTID